MEGMMRSKKEKKASERGYRYVDITNSPRAQVVRPDGWAPELFWVERYQARDEKWLKSSAGIKSGSDKKAFERGDVLPLWLCILGGLAIQGIFLGFVLYLVFPSAFQFLEEIPLEGRLLTGGGLFALSVFVGFLLYLRDWDDLWHV